MSSRRQRRVASRLMPREANRISWQQLPSNPVHGNVAPNTPIGTTNGHDHHSDPIPEIKHEDPEPRSPNAAANRRSRSSDPEVESRDEDAEPGPSSATENEGVRSSNTYLESGSGPNRLPSEVRNRRAATYASRPSVVSRNRLRETVHSNENHHRVPPLMLRLAPESLAATDGSASDRHEPIHNPENRRRAHSTPPSIAATDTEDAELRAKVKSEVDDNDRGDWNDDKVGDAIDHDARNGKHDSSDDSGSSDNDDARDGDYIGVVNKMEVDDDVADNMDVDDDEESLPTERVGVVTRSRARAAAATAPIKQEPGGRSVSPTKPVNDNAAIWKHEFRDAREARRNPYVGPQGLSDVEALNDFALMRLEPGHPILTELIQKLQETPTVHDDKHWTKIINNAHRKLHEG